MSGIPQCFGKLWSNTAAECKGGLDPSYINPQTNTNRRDPCKWFQACASKTGAASLSHGFPGGQQQAPTQLIPLNRLANPPGVFPISQGPGQPVRLQPQQQHPYYQQPQYVQPQPQQYQQPQYIPQVPQGMYVTPQQAYHGPQFVPAPMQQPGMQVHGYITIPEPVRDDVHWFMRLTANAVRAMVKAATHETAHFVDHNTFNRPQPLLPAPLPLPQIPPTQ